MGRRGAPFFCFLQDMVRARKTLIILGTLNSFCALNHEETVSLVCEIDMLIYRRDKSAGKREMQLRYKPRLPVMFVAAPAKREESCE